MISRNDILRAFPPESMPSTIPLVVSTLKTGIDEETMDAADFFRGRRWDELTAKDFAPDAPFLGFLTDAWRWYYIPALICCSLEELQTFGYLPVTDLAVNYIIGVWGSYTYPECNAMENMRQLFSKEQAIIVQEWVSMLILSPNELSLTDADRLLIFLEKYTGIMSPICINDLSDWISV